MKLSESKIVWSEEAYVLHERPPNNPFRTLPHFRWHFRGSLRSFFLQIAQSESIQSA